MTGERRNSIIHNHYADRPLTLQTGRWECRASGCFGSKAAIVTLSLLYGSEGPLKAKGLNMDVVKSSVRTQLPRPPAHVR